MSQFPNLSTLFFLFYDYDCGHKDYGEIESGGEIKFWVRKMLNILALSFSNCMILREVGGKQGVGMGNSKALRNCQGAHSLVLKFMIRDAVYPLHYLLRWASLSSDSKSSNSKFKLSLVRPEISLFPEMWLF